MKTCLARTFGSIRKGVFFVSCVLLSRIADIGTTYHFLRERDWNYAYETNEDYRQLMQTLGFFPASAINISVAVGTPLLFLLLLNIALTRLNFTARCRQQLACVFFAALSSAWFLVAIYNAAKTISLFPFPWINRHFFTIPFPVWDKIILTIGAVVLLTILAKDRKHRKTTILPG